MELTDEVKQRIDDMSYEQLLYQVRFSKIGEPLLQGPSGEYLLACMAKVRNAPGGNQIHVQASKKIGWS